MNTIKTTMLAIIIVNFKNEDKTISYIQNEIVKVDVPNIVVIVNNSATSESDNTLTTGLQSELVIDITKNPAKNSRFVVSHPENLGYAKGNNLGVEFAIKHFDITHILITNNDIRFISNNVVKSLINKLDSLNNIAIIGPKVIGLDGKNQSPEPYVPFWNRYIWMYWITPFLPSNKKVKLFKLDYSQLATEGVHYKVMGSFFIIKKSDFVSCGMMDTNTFLYGEEVILSERLNAIGKKVYYFPDVTVLHEHGQTISNHLDAKRRKLNQFLSESYYYSTYRKVSNLSILIGKFSLNCYIKMKKV